MERHEIEERHGSRRRPGGEVREPLVEDVCVVVNGRAVEGFVADVKLREVVEGGCEPRQLAKRREIVVESPVVVEIKAVFPPGCRKAVEKLALRTALAVEGRMRGLSAGGGEQAKRRRSRV